MPLDGIVVNALVHEFNDRILNSKIEKIYQPESDELIFIIRNKGKSERLLLSASSNNPRIHFTTVNKSNPDVPPMFCMLLRKHLMGGRIIAVTQPDFERIIYLMIESYNELGDLTTKKLIIEIMGRHSNIILVDSNGKIIDSIKHIGINISSVRQVMPGLDYVLPPSQEKLNPLDCSEQEIFDIISRQSDGLKVDKCIVNNFTGISPLIGREICFRALHNSDYYIGELSEDQIKYVAGEMCKIFDQIKNGQFLPVLLYDKEAKRVVDFSAVNILQYENLAIETDSSISSILDTFYSKRDSQDRLKQKSSDLLKIINTNLDRCKKKLALQQQKLGEVSNREKFKTYGDLITANIYRIQQGMDKVEVENFYEEGCPVVTIPLDPELSPSRNAQKYFNEYAKAKNAAKMVTEQMELNIHEIDYLESVHDEVIRATNEQELNEIKDEIAEQGYISQKSKQKSQKNVAPSKPMHFISSDGIDIFVGKNNRQNDYLTLKFARDEDLWFHTKNIPGSHTIVKTGGKKDIPDTTLLQAAALAAYFSKGKYSSNVAVDYTTVKNVKKPSGAKPGMVIYENYKTVYVTPDEELITALSPGDQ
ncbi:MAG: fbpA [Clostridia bacterium]|jgi:predicted ribosome quality control (RQC) complex YloA/Tae2 family protein|uniref:Rqc2 family fibronectin-binding protein n=1 Tax=Petroclostridium xylanilyticum TaxID=1792311 RepID=UPI000B98658D|nr:NFACT RNA binding domain-containing protein [Petroclostridium xylanilyticum]MBZ4645811.1 fbpA [Clostridia bacterium]